MRLVRRARPRAAQLCGGEAQGAQGTCWGGGTHEGGGLYGGLMGCTHGGGQRGIYRGRHGGIMGGDLRAHLHIPQAQVLQRPRTRQSQHRREGSHPWGTQRGAQPGLPQGGRAPSPSGLSHRSSRVRLGHCPIACTTGQKSVGDMRSGVETSAPHVALCRPCRVPMVPPPHGTCTSAAVPERPTWHWASTSSVTLHNAPLSNSLRMTPCKQGRMSTAQWGVRCTEGWSVGWTAEGDSGWKGEACCCHAGH